MGGESRKWLVLVATVWIQAFTGTNFDFSAYSSELKSVLGVSQFLLNYLAVASDLGKAFGWSSGLALLYMPAWAALFIAATLGLAGYGVQWLLIQRLIALPYPLVFLMCLLAGLSICWFNTVCFVACIRCFPTNRSLALALTVSFNGLSPALYDLAAHSFSVSTAALPPLYLLLNALLPLAVSLATALPIARHSAPPASFSTIADSLVFLALNLLAVLVGVYLVLADSLSFTSLFAYRGLFLAALFLLTVPLAVPGVVYAREWAHSSIHRSFRITASGFNLVGAEELELYKGLLSDGGGGIALPTEEEKEGVCDGEEKERGWWSKWVMRKDGLLILGEEHGVRRLLGRVDFWLYYLSYFCGATVGLVYSNNVGQILESLGGGSNTTSLVSLYSTSSFFGRLLSATPDFFRGRVYFARTGWLAMALIPTPVAFFLLALSGSIPAVYVATALIGSSSGFIFAAAVSVTSELFGVDSFGVNHNIIISNIPLGSLLYGSLAALVYDANGTASDSTVTCDGRKCYASTFVVWGCVSLFGLMCNVLLYVRTRFAYDMFERTRRGIESEF
ncbi:protein NUCLEAR FUSION DEFECTIVE 4 isoform X2 [Nymphaea colorata]|uniref:protein NUCLEAR FUSION DEFECTIVE 4 isoform X2 n=1 Tax=Nymphaea colorata TaxID=210225 RepID=UPI00129E4854|nr:protein NUCLEAR FUSION DEFECTIVE 4 isoform X2 [Nymphaea colorata]